MHDAGTSLLFHVSFHSWKMAYIYTLPDFISQLKSPQLRDKSESSTAAREIKSESSTAAREIKSGSSLGSGLYSCCSLTVSCEVGTEESSSSTSVVMTVELVLLLLVPSQAAATDVPEG